MVLVLHLHSITIGIICQEKTNLHPADKSSFFDVEEKIPNKKGQGAKNMGTMENNLLQKDTLLIGWGTVRTSSRS
jgi:hypothetical protein